MIATLKTLHREESGQDLVEYALNRTDHRSRRADGNGETRQQHQRRVHQDRGKTHLVSVCRL